jgi:hypothetical protein
VTRNARFLATAAAVIAVVASGCRGGATAKDPPSTGPGTATAPSAVARGGRTAAKVAPTAVLPDGAAVALELATTQEEITRGLMFRPSLAADRGMLFVFGQERVPSFWMKDTLIPLDIVFLDGAGRVVDMAVNAQPCQAEPCPQYMPKRPAAAVLEMAAGSVTRHGLVVGDQLVFSHVPQYPLG